MNSFLNVKTANKYLQFGPDKCKSMLIGNIRKKFDFLHNLLEVDTWKTTHDEDGNMIETYEGKTKIEGVDEMIYLGVVISCAGKNLKNIIHKGNKAIGTKKQIMNMVKESGKYTIECGFIYLNSLLRGSILCGAEAMINMKEDDYRKIEQIEEDQMRLLFETDRSCSIHLMYLESGQVPARFQIKRMGLNFYHYILNQKEDSLLYQMLDAQRKSPIKNDFHEKIKNTIKEFDMNEITEVKNMSKNVFKKLVKEKCQKGAPKYLLEKQSRKVKEMELGMKVFKWLIT